MGTGDVAGAEDWCCETGVGKNKKAARKTGQNQIKRDGFHDKLRENGLIQKPLEDIFEKIKQYADPGNPRFEPNSLSSISDSFDPNLQYKLSHENLLIDFRNTINPLLDVMADFLRANPCPTGKYLPFCQFPGIWSFRDFVDPTQIFNDEVDRMNANEKFSYRSQMKVVRRNVNCGQKAPSKAWVRDWKKHVLWKFTKLPRDEFSALSIPSFSTYSKELENKDRSFKTPPKDDEALEKIRSEFGGAFEGQLLQGKIVDAMRVLGVKGPRSAGGLGKMVGSDWPENGLRDGEGKVEGVIRIITNICNTLWISRSESIVKNPDDEPQRPTQEEICHYAPELLHTLDPESFMKPPKNNRTLIHY